MSDWLDDLPETMRDRVERQGVPEWTDPMLATLTHETFSDPGWIYERKLDGERCLAFRDDGETSLLSRSQRDLDPTYPEIVEALDRQAPESCVLDGEIVAFSGSVTSFSRLQGRMQIRDADEARSSGIAVYYYLFDILNRDGRDVTGLPLRVRKSLLRGAVRWDDPLRFTRHRNEDGEAWLEEACRKGWEGLIAKRADSGYVHSRSRSWLKFKCVARQELVVGGWTEPGGEREGFGALLLGYYEDDHLRYAGKVGAGFDDETLRDLAHRLASLERKTSPFADDDAGGADVHFATPKLVVEVAFTEWTDAGKLRHPRYVGRRVDKDPEDVVRERPVEEEAS
jgi:bifunctional non-homologous end joining protein LigD